jgi:hypothetical protein
VTDEKSGGGGPQIRGCLDQERNRLRKLGLAATMLEWVKWAPHIDSKGMSTYIYMLLGLTFPTQPNKPTQLQPLGPNPNNNNNFMFKFAFL